MALYARDILEFSTFPTLLLLLTLFRLSLNISTTRLILSNNGEAGNVIKTFGNFVVGSNLVVGLVVFLIIVIIQFIIITKGSERVAEVAARFTLDAMPGKQMAIDADLNAGIIDETKARERRSAIQKEADFYGAMDGASKFVKGDAIVGIIIVIINIVGGILIGALGLGGKTMAFDQVIQVYTLATVGDGLCSQIPALLISTSTGIIVTRSTGDETFGQDLTGQMLAKPELLYMLGAMIGMLSLIPGLPKIPMWILAAALPFYGYSRANKKKKAEEDNQKVQAEHEAMEKRKPENVTSLLQVDPLEMEFGYGIIPLVDATQGGDLLDRVVMIRPPVRARYGRHRAGGAASGQHTASEQLICHQDQGRGCGSRRNHAGPLSGSKAGRRQRARGRHRDGGPDVRTAGGLDHRSRPREGGDEGLYDHRRAVADLDAPDGNHQETLPRIVG